MTDKTNNNDKSNKSGEYPFEDDVIDWQDLSRPSFIPKRKSSAKKTTHRKHSDKIFYEYQQCFLSNEDTVSHTNSDKNYPANIISNNIKQHTPEQQRHANSEFHVISDNLPTLDECENIETINTSTLSHDELSLTEEIKQLIERHTSSLKHEEKSLLLQAILNIITASK